MKTSFRTHNCDELELKDINKSVKLAGWVDRIRDHGSLLFIDLRDNYGITQIVFNPEKNKTNFDKASSLKLESVVFIEGVVVKREEDTINPELNSGQIEIECENLIIDSVVNDLPFLVNEEGKISEDLRLRYRFLDLRKQRLHQNILLRSTIIKEVRNILQNMGFNEFQTPILTVSSPEGARDYLVPSRVHPGQFYALPQAPQQYKQLIMCAGFDKYFQIAPCFRDEDARADRSPGEFYQLDIEMSFISQQDLFKIIEDLFKKLSPLVSKKKILTSPFPQISYVDAMNMYGSDKPDIRFDMKIHDVTEIFENSKFKIFAKNTTNGRNVKAIVYSNSLNCTRSFYEDLESFVQKNGAAGLAYIRKESEGFDGYSGPIAKVLSKEEFLSLEQSLNLKAGDTVFFGADKWKNVCNTLGKLRVHLAEEKNLIDKSVLSFVWVVDFPMYEWDDEKQQFIFSHNPFSMPQGGLESLKKLNPKDILAYQYDLVCNGIELSSGAIRNHKPEIMYKAFELAGYKKEEVDKEFGHMIKAFSYGAPPHGGIAPGIDRLVMIYADEPNIREVIMFPMNQKAQELMVGSPAPISERQLRELKLNVVKKK